MADALAEHWRLSTFKRPWRWRARVARGEVDGEAAMVVKPWTYMNRSGTALGPLLEDPDFDPARDLLVVVDEVALPLGTIRLRPHGSAGGHNGLKSIAGRLQSEEYARLRIGIGPRPEEIDQSDFVLAPFLDEETTALRALVPTILEAIDCWRLDGVETAMNRYNRRGTQSE